MHKLALAGAIVLSVASTAVATDMTTVGDLVIHHPWARASIGNTPNSAAYMMLETTGAADLLVDASTPAAADAQLHGHVMEGGVAKMRRVDAIEVAPGAPVVLEPGGLHLMLMGLTEKLAEGATMPLTLVFEHAGEVTLEVPIAGMAGGGHGAMHHGDQHSN